MGNLPQEINFGALVVWLAGTAANYDNMSGRLLFGLGVLAGVVKLADFSFTFYKNHLKRKK